MDQWTIGIVGVGAMGSALVKGFVSSGSVAAQAVGLYDIDRERVGKVAQETGCRIVPTLADLVGTSRCIILAVKPQQLPKLLKIIAPKLEDHLVVSLAAGIDLNFLQQQLPAGCEVARVMPNTPALIGHGAIAVSFAANVSDERQGRLCRLLESVGSVVVVAETQMNAVTALSGSGPAYVYLMLESLISAGVTAGLSRQVSRQLALETVIGAAKMVKSSGEHPAVLAAQVTSPGGTTAAGLRVLEAKGVRSGIIEAVLAAKARAEEMGRDS